MKSVKSQGSSCHKGKEVVSDDLATRDVGEEATHYESDRSNEEEAWHDPYSECVPLIYPWYNTYAHFLKVPSKYTMPLPNRVWLAICCHNKDISWAPLASLIPDLVIHQGTLLPIPILFEFGSGTALGRKEWVDNELSDKGFMEALQWAGVLKAIVSSHCLSNYKDLFNLYHLVCQWFIATHTFFLSYSEITVTLEDMANQLLLPIFGDVDLGALELSRKEEAV